MTKDEPPRKPKEGAPTKPDAERDSLDFTDGSPRVDHVAPISRDASKRRSASNVRPGKTPGSGELEKPRGFRRVVVPVLIIIAVGLTVRLVMTERGPEELTSPSRPAKPTPPTYPTTPAPKPPQTSTPPAKVQTPPSQADAPQTLQPPAIPAEFLQVFQTYSGKTAPKALALALDSKGRWAYGSIAGYSTQSGANEEALSECARFKAQSDIQEKCRLYAVADKVVW
jgi:hypothetical protein